MRFLTAGMKRISNAIRMASLEDEGLGRLVGRYTVPIGPMKPTDGISIRKMHGPGFAKYEAILVPGPRKRCADLRPEI